MGITPHTPLRTGHATFSHPAPYKAYTSKVSAIDIDINLGCSEVITAKDITKSVPCITFLLAPPIQPVEQHSLYSVQHIIQAPPIIGDTIVMIVSRQDLIHTLEDILKFPCAHVSDHYIELPTFLGKFLLAGFPLNSEPAPVGCGAVVRET